MAAIFSLLIVLALSHLVTRIGAMALMLTGMSKEASIFQSRSAFTGVGFTTRESEEVVAHPVRRRIVMLLMLLGNLGVATVVAALMLSFTSTAASGQWWWRFLLLIVGLAVLCLVGRSRILERQLNRIIAWSLRKWGHLEIRDYVSLLQLQDGFTVSELVVEKNDWLANKTLIQLRLPKEGVMVLGIRRKDGRYLATPTGDTVVLPEDSLTLYGHINKIKELDQRYLGRKGDSEHLASMDEFQEEKNKSINLKNEVVLSPSDRPS